MIFVVIAIIILVIITFLLMASKIQAKEEVIAEGGLRNIFSVLDSVLLSEEFIFYQDKISSIEYFSILDNAASFKLIIRKNLDLHYQYEMQLYHTVHGKDNLKSIPYIITPQLTFEQYSESIVKMLREITDQQIEKLTADFKRRTNS